MKTRADNWTNAARAAGMVVAAFLAHGGVEVLTPTPPADEARKYEKVVRKAVAKHWPKKWHPYAMYWWAQLKAESNLDEETCKRENSKRAKCLAQITPIAEKELRSIGFMADARADAVAAIHGGALYMAHLDRMNRKLLPKGPRPPLCELNNAQVAYVSGPMNLAKAAREASIQHENHYLGGMCWKGDIDHHMRRVISGDNYRDVRSYLGKIVKFGFSLLAGERVEVKLSF